MEERFPSWVPVLSVALFSGALGWWLGRREGQLSARVAGLEAPRRRLFRTGEDQLSLNPPSQDGQGESFGEGIAMSPEASDGGEATTSQQSFSSTSDEGGEGSVSKETASPGSDKGAEASVAKEKATSLGPVSPQRAPVRAVVENAPGPKLRAKTTETAESQPVSSAPSSMRSSSEYSMEQPRKPKIVPMASANQTVHRAVVVSSPTVARRR